MPAEGYVFSEAIRAFTEAQAIETKIASQQRALFRAVIEKAILDATGCHEKQGCLKDEAITWLDGAVDFPTICEVAGLETQDLRRLIKRRLEIDKAALVSQERVEPSGQFSCLMLKD